VSAKCKSCDADIIWVRMNSGKPMPLDAKPEKRVVQNIGSPVYRVADAYISHFVTCPNAAQHRRKA